MYKETIISIVIIIFVFVLNNIAQKHTDNTLGKTNEELYNLRSKIENVLIQTALSIDYSIQFYNTTENIDTTKIISEMKDNELVKHIKKLKERKQQIMNGLQ